MIQRSTFPIALFLFLSSPVFAESLIPQHSISGVLGVPHPITLAYDYRINRTFSTGFSMGFFNYTYKYKTGDDIRLSSENYDIRGRIHPFGAAFFIGVMLGTRKYQAEATRDIPLASGFNLPVTGTLTISSYYVTPHLGWFWVSQRGFTIGVELGCQIPLDPSTNISIPVADTFFPQVRETADYQALVSDINGPALQIGRTILPYLALLRLGWTF